eukprot:8756818-Pyramimonas_sp.AAC.1
MDQCMTGLKDSKGVAIKEPTQMYANHVALLAPYHKFKCDGSHTHATACKRAGGGGALHSNTTVSHS